MLIRSDPLNKLQSHLISSMINYLPICPKCHDTKYVTQDTSFTKLYKDILFHCSACKIKFRKRVIND